MRPINSHLNLPIPKLAFFDVDGTLIGSSGDVNQEVIEALANLSNKGCLIGLASGRPHFSSASLFRKLGVTGPSIMMAGAIVVSPDGSELASTPLSILQVNQITKLLKELGLPIELYTFENYYVEELNEILETHATHYLKHPHCVVSSFEGILAQQSPLKVLTICNREKVDSVVSSLDKIEGIRCAPGLGSRHPEFAFINILQEGALPNLMLEALLPKYNAHKDHILSCGDAPSDIPLLREAGISIAMGNASDEVKSAARHVTKDVEENGVSFAIHQLFSF